MAGLFALSIDLTAYQGKFLDDLFWETFYRQHLGEQYGGLSTWDGKKIKIQTHRGLFRNAFQNNLTDLKGTEGIGYCGHTREPLFVYSKIGEMSVCFSGNIINRQELVDEFKNFGHTFERGGDDIEIIVKLIAQGVDIIYGIKRMAEKIKGAFALLILTKEGIYAVRCPTGHWPLVIGEKKGAVVVSSESGGFKNFGFKLVRDIKPGEIVLLKKGKLETKGTISGEKVQICSFIWVYTAFPNGVFEGVPASLVRKRLGAALARRDIERGFIPDIVTPVPDSGRFHAVGYHQEFCRQMMEGKIRKIPLYDEVLLKWPYTGRSFTPQEEKERKLEARIKLLVSGEDYTGKVLVINDDSIVRGTQTSENLVPKAESLGVKEIHFRISNPELHSYCPYGKTTKRGELFAAKIPSKEERTEFLGSKAGNKQIVKSLEYNTVEDLVEAIGLPREQLCVDCDMLEKNS